MLPSPSPLSQDKLGSSRSHSQGTFSMSVREKYVGNILKWVMSLPPSQTMMSFLSEPFSWQRFVLVSAIVTVLTAAKKWLWIFYSTVGRDFT